MDIWHLGDSAGSGTSIEFILEDLVSQDYNGEGRGGLEVWALLDSLEDPSLPPSFIHSLPSWGKFYIWGEPWIQVAGASQPVDHLTLIVHA